MKKKTLLSLLTGIAIVASTAGTYAAWDQTSDSSNGTVQFRNPITVKAQDTTYTLSQNNGSISSTGESTDPSFSTPTESPVLFTVKNNNSLADTLSIKPVIKYNNQEDNSLDSYLNITISKDNATTLDSGESASGGTNNQALVFSGIKGDSSPNGEQFKCDVNVSIKGNPTSDIQSKLTDGKLSIDLVGTLSKAPADDK